MNYEIGELNATMRAFDSQALLDPQVLDQITRIVLRRVREETEHDQRAQRERQLDPGVTEPETNYPT